MPIVKSRKRMWEMKSGDLFVFVQNNKKVLRTFVCENKNISRGIRIKGVKYYDSIEQARASIGIISLDEWLYDIELSARF